MRKDIRTAWFALAMLAGQAAIWMGQSVLAQTRGNEEESYPRPIPVGPLDLRAGVAVLQRFDDNIFYTDDFKVSSPITTVQPSIQLGREYREQKFSLGYSLRNTTFWEQHQNDFIDHYFTANADLVVTNRNRFKLSNIYTRNHNRIGTFFTQGGVSRNTRVPDGYDGYTGTMEYTYGLPTATGNLALMAQYHQISYNNNLVRTRFQGRQDVLLRPSFRYRISPTAQAVVEFEHNAVDYDLQSSFGQNGTKRRYLFGFTWDKAARLAGSARIGYVEQRYDNVPSLARSEFTWETQLSWQLKPYSTLNLNISRDFRAAFNLGGTAFVEEYGVDWRHYWRDNVFTTLAADYAKYKYVQQSDRRDNIFSIDVGFNYIMAPGIVFRLGYEYAERRSTIDGFGFHQNVVMLSIGTESPWNLVQEDRPF